MSTSNDPVTNYISQPVKSTDIYAQAGVPYVAPVQQQVATQTVPEVTTPKVTPAPATATQTGAKKVTSFKPNADGTYTWIWSDGSTTNTNDFTNPDPTAPKNSAGSPISTATSVSTSGTLARDTFTSTLALFFGAAEAAKPWATELYNVTSKYYKTGSTVDESFNLALQDSRNNPNLSEFTKRFQGIYALQDAKAAGKAVSVPTIAEYYNAENQMGNVLRQAGLGEIATQDYLGSVIGKGLSVTDVGNYINNIYTEIQNLPADIKSSVMEHYPTLDNVSLAKSILTGDKGFSQLQKEVTSYEIQGLAKKQGLGDISNATAMDLAGQGITMASAAPGMLQAGLAQPTVDLLSNITAGQTPMTAEQTVQATVGGLASQRRKMEQLSSTEQARFSGQSGTAKGAFSTGYLSKQSGAGAY